MRPSTPLPFEIQYRPNRINDTGKRVQEIVFSFTGGNEWIKNRDGTWEERKSTFDTSRKRLLVMWKTAIDDLKECHGTVKVNKKTGVKETSGTIGAFEEIPRDWNDVKECNSSLPMDDPNYCRIVGKGRYTIGGTTEKNPFALTFTSPSIDDDSGSRNKLVFTLSHFRQTDYGKISTIKPNQCGSVIKKIKID